MPHHARTFASARLALPALLPPLLAALAGATSARGASPAPAADASGGVDFGRDVLPVLSENCFQCHGPDEKARKAGLRFDTREGAFRVKDGKRAIVPGKSAESELVRRVTSGDPSERMPPPESRRRPTDAQIEILRRWIDQGAPWARHWAFVPPARPQVPSVRRVEWPRGPIDRFILARLERERLEPSPGARKETLLRRVTLDLTGLPPAPAEVDAFLADESPSAYERVLDRLLASPAYGERMAADWLDVARYADTHGYQMDRYRPMWPWRDWVIQAFNEDLPFDRFVTWQLAGDLLPGATKEERLATAFNRLHLQNEEGGVIEEEFRTAYVVDRVVTMGTAFLGLTLECSRCHDHKFDPISQREFYQLFSFFNNIDEFGQTSYFTDSMPVPTLLLSDDAADARLLDLRRRIGQAVDRLAAVRDGARPAFEEWLARKTETPSIPGCAGDFPFDEIRENRLANLADPAKPAEGADDPKLAPGRSGQCVELTGDNGLVLRGLGKFSRTDPFSFALWLATPSHAPRMVVLHRSQAANDAGSRGYELLLEGGRVSVGLHHMWPRNSLKVITREAIPEGQWTHVAFTYDGSSRAAGLNVYVNGAPAAVDVVRDGLWKDITYERGDPELELGYRFRDSGFKGGRVDDLKVFGRELTAIEAAHLAGRSDLVEAWSAQPGELTSRQREELREYYLANLHGPSRDAARDLQALRAEQSRLVNPIPEAMVMEEMPGHRPTFLLKRGAYDAPGERVFAGTPAALPPFPPGEPRNRLGLARWLLAPGHPLAARVAANRAWQLLFGKGIVETSDNFGSQGAAPTHPELLDWLAWRLIDLGWDWKALLREIALSATYQQSSQASPELLARDPQNQLLARGPSRRLTAEMLRDQALASSGLLVRRIGGPSVKPYQPEGLWEEKAMGAPRYDQGKGPDLYRRTLYTFWKRTVPHPALIAFDAAERNACTVRRQSTSTPLQALALLNDTQVVEASRFLGERMLREGGAGLGARVEWLFHAVTSRRPTPKEAAILEQLFREQRELFGRGPEAAAKLLSVGEGRSDPSLSPGELAAAAVLAEAVLNHDEAVFRR